MCADYFDDFLANITCKGLGFKSGRLFSEANYGDLMMMASLSVMSFNCSGTETSLSECNRTDGWHCQSIYAIVRCEGDNNNRVANNLHASDRSLPVMLELNMCTSFLYALCLQFEMA